MMPGRRALLQTSLAAGLLATVAGLAYVADVPRALGLQDHDGWRPIAWPFPRDAWPPGHAWRRGDLEVYVRPKLGFCGNCDTGVVTDEEVDRVTDIDLLDEHFIPAQGGDHARVANLVGRSRLYKLKMKDGSRRLAEGFAVASKCDLVVAIVLGDVAGESTRRAAHQFLESNTVQAWLNDLLEGR